MPRALQNPYSQTSWTPLCSGRNNKYSVRAGTRQCGTELVTEPLHKPTRKPDAEPYEAALVGLALPVRSIRGLCGRYPCRTCHAPNATYERLDPVDSAQITWQSIGIAATIGIFLLMFGVLLYVGRAILMPVLAAAIVAMTFAPLVRRGNRHGIPPWITAGLIVIVALGALGIRGHGHGRPGQRVDRSRPGDSARRSKNGSRFSTSRLLRSANLR